MCVLIKKYFLYIKNQTHVLWAWGMGVWHVLGEGQVKLELSSRNFLVLDGVDHIFYIRKNLISTSLLVQQGYKVVFESNRVGTRHGVFIGKCYICDDLFKLCLMSLSTNKISNISSFCCKCWMF